MSDALGSSITSTVAAHIAPCIFHDGYLRRDRLKLLFKQSTLRQLRFQVALHEKVADGYEEATVGQNVTERTTGRGHRCVYDVSVSSMNQPSKKL